MREPAAPMVRRLFSAPPEPTPTGLLTNDTRRPDNAGAALDQTRTSKTYDAPTDVGGRLRARACRASAGAGRPAACAGSRPAVRRRRRAGRALDAVDAQWRHHRHV